MEFLIIAFLIFLNALFVAAVELLKTSGQAEWQRAALVPMFALFDQKIDPLAVLSGTTLTASGTMFARPE